MGWDLKAKAINGGRNRKRGGRSGSLPIFITQPDDYSGAEFSTGTFTAVAESPDPENPSVTYQWQYRLIGGEWTDAIDGVQPQGTDVSGAKSTTLTLANISGSADGIEIRCEACNVHGCTFSSVATITITSAVFFFITEAGDFFVDESGADNFIDERSA